MAEISRGRKYTTIEELEKSDKGPIWVLNNTRDALEGKVVVSIPKKNGNGSDVLRVARSFIPFDLTMQVGRAQILDSSDFRQTVGKKLLKLITPEYAAVLLNTEEAKEEQTRLKNDENKAKMALKKAGIVEEVSTGVGEDDDEEYFEVATTEKGKKAAAKKVEQKVKAKEDGTKRSPSIKVQNLVAAASRDEHSDAQILGAIKRLSNLKKVDLSFLSKQYSDKPKIIKHLKAVLAEKKAAAVA